jgi:phosphoglycerate kinase
MRTIKDLKLTEKRILLRCDFNVPLGKKGEILDDFRIRRALDTILYLLKNRARIIIISHLGRPEGRVQKRYSLRPVALRLEKLLAKKIEFLEDCLGKKVRNSIGKMEPGKIILLENLRFYRGEVLNDKEFARSLSTLGEVYINDAFSVCHRNHASIVALPKFLPSAAGLLLEKEINSLLAVIKNPKRPLIAIIGGKKIQTKIKLIKKFLDLADHLILGGQIANAIFAGKGLAIGKFLTQTQLIDEISKIELTNPKLHLPIDALVGLANLDKDYSRQTAIGKVREEEEIFDIGPETIHIFSEIISSGKTILWNGPLGYIEDERFINGTFSIADKIIKTRAFSVVGGGDTNAFLAKYGLRKSFSHVSTGGGAMLAFLAGERLPGIEVLNKNPET